MSESLRIPEDFFYKAYREAYTEDFLNTKIAVQIRVLREQRGWTQEELAQKIGTKQSGIARLENVNHARWNIETLKKLARAFDVAFLCGFESFSSFLDEANSFSRKALERPGFDDEVIMQTQSVEEAVVTSPGIDHSDVSIASERAYPQQIETTHQASSVISAIYVSSFPDDLARQRAQTFTREFLSSIRIQYDEPLIDILRSTFETPIATGVAYPEVILS